MSAISEFSERQQKHNQRIAAGLDAIVADVRGLQALIEKLQGTPGAITPADQALLDQIDAGMDALATRVEGVDELTPPAPPAA